MKVLTSGQLEQINGVGTRPHYLIEITLDSPMYLSTRHTVAWNGHTWVESECRVNSIGPEEASIQILNKEFQYTMGALTGDYQRQAVRIWWSYGIDEHLNYVEEGYVQEGYVQGPQAAEPILIFDGIINSLPNVNMWLDVTATRTPPRRYPRWRILPPRANHLTPAGAVIVFGGESIRLESRK